MQQPEGPRGPQHQRLLEMYKLADGRTTWDRRSSWCPASLCAWPYERPSCWLGVSATCGPWTSWSELRRDGLRGGRAAPVRPVGGRRVRVTFATEGHGRSVVAADYMGRCRGWIHQYVPNQTVSADGYAISDTRPAARRPSSSMARANRGAGSHQPGRHRRNRHLEGDGRAPKKYELDDPTAGTSGSLEGGAA